MTRAGGDDGDLLGETDAAGRPDPPRGRRVRRWFRRQPRWRRRVLVAVLALLTALVTCVGGLGVALFAEGSGAPSSTARTSGHDALWLGHAWVGWEPGSAKVAKRIWTGL